MSKTNDREIIEDTVLTMLFDKEHSFYANVISLTKIVQDNTVPTLGVRYSDGLYYMHINTDFFSKYSLNVRINLIKHECLHIIYLHLLERSDFSNQQVANIAMDMTINRVLSELPEGAVYSENFNLPDGLNTEQYYELLIKDEEEQSEPDDIGDHKWELSDIDTETITDTTEELIQEALSKSKGKLPYNIDEILTIYERKSTLRWQDILRRLQGNKKAFKRSTIKRRDRRLPNYTHLRGKTTSTTFTLVVVLDVSGSMQTRDINLGLNEIKTICELTGSALELIQIDTEVKGISTFDESSISLNRKGKGGTYMYPAIEYIRDNNIEHDAIVFISDLYIEEVQHWDTKPKVPVMWLGTDRDGFNSFNIESTSGHSKYLLE